MTSNRKDALFLVSLMPAAAAAMFGIGFSVQIATRWAIQEITRWLNVSTVSGQMAITCVVLTLVLALLAAPICVWILNHRKQTLSRITQHTRSFVLYITAYVFALIVCAGAVLYLGGAFHPIRIL